MLRYGPGLLEITIIQQYILGIMHTVFVPFRFAVVLYWSPDCKVHEANMVPTWGWQDPGGPHVGFMNLAIWVNFPGVRTMV